MARLALATAGAVVGSFVGMPGLGWAIGSAIGGLAFPDEQPGVEGPRLDDLQVQSSAYGAGIPVCFGTVRMAGNIIWAADLEERRTTDRVGGKGGPGGQKVTTSEYFATFAVGLCAGEAQSVRRIWMDNKLVWDSSGNSVEITVPNLAWRFYPGSEDQLSDPAYEELVGAENAVAYRGLCYVVFEDLPVKYFGNRPPSVSVELVMSGEKTAIITSVADITSASSSAGAVLWDRGKFYTASGTTLIEVDIDTLEVREVGEFPAGPTWLSAAGDYVIATYQSSGRVDRMNINTGVFDAYSSGGFAGLVSTLTTPAAIIGGGGDAIITVPTLMAGPLHYFVCTPHYGTPAGTYCIQVDTTPMRYVWGAAGYPAPFTAPIEGRWLQGEQRATEESTDAYYFVGDGAGNVSWWKVVFTSNTQVDEDYVPVGVTATQMPDITPALIGASGGLDFGGAYLAYDLLDGNILIGALGGRTCKFDTAGNLLWSTASAGGGGGGRTDRLRGGTFAMADGPGALSPTSYLYSTKDGSLIEQFWTGFWAEYRHYDSDRQGIYAGVSSGAAPVRELLNRDGADPVPLADVVADLCRGAGLAPTDIDVSALSGDVRGYVIARPMRRREALQPLMAAYLFDAVESNDVIEFRPRGGAEVATVLHDDLVREGEGGVIVETRAQDVELPRVLTIRHIDPDRGYEAGAQRWQRPMAPTPTQQSRDEQTIDLPLVMDADTAKTLARRLLTSVWRERTRYQLTGTTQHLRLEPADPVTLTLADGSTVRVRLGSAQLGADWTLRMEAVAEAAADYALTAEADGGQGYPPDTLPLVRPVRGFAPALPLLRDSDDTHGTALRGYLLASTYSDGRFRGADVYRLTGSSWLPEDAVLDAAAWGGVVSAVPVPANYWTWDDTNEIVVSPVVGADRIVGATESEVLGWANLGCLLASDGTVELVQHVNATANADGTITLSRLLRGRRGTEDAGEIPAGSIYLLLDGAEIGIASALSALGGSESFRFVGPLESVQTAQTVSRAVVGRAEQPYAPVHIAGARDGASNVTLSWVRRTRLLGGLRDYSGTVPLNEASESYQVDIRNGADTATLRTISVTSPSATYTAAEQAADGLTPGDPVTVRVYQISATVGRGRAGVATV